MRIFQPPPAPVWEASALLTMLVEEGFPGGSPFPSFGQVYGRWEPYTFEHPRVTIPDVSPS